MTQSVLGHVALFADLPEPDLEHLCKCLRARRLKRGETVFMRGDPGDSLCVVESGLVKITLGSPEGKELILALLGPGAFFGELALLDGGPRSADAVAIEPTTLHLLQRSDFLDLLVSRPGMSARLLAVLAERLRQDDEIVQDVAFLDVPARLAAAILRLVEEGDTTTQVVGRRLTQAELAGLVGTTRESINRWIGHFERVGLIRYERGRITVLEPQGLRRRIY